MTDLNRRESFAASQRWRELFLEPDAGPKRGDGVPWEALAEAPGTLHGGRAEAAYRGQPTHLWLDQGRCFTLAATPTVVELLEMVEDEGEDAVAVASLSEGWTFIVTHEPEFRYLYREMDLCAQA